MVVPIRLANRTRNGELVFGVCMGVTWVSYFLLLGCGRFGKWDYIARWWVARRNYLGIAGDAGSLNLVKMV